MLSHAEKLINTWFLKREIVFGQDSYTIKAHQVIHLPQQIKKFGPLWASSSFFGKYI